MKTILVAVALLLVACGKKASEAPKGDCTASVENALSLSKEDFKKSNVADATIPKIKEASVTRCKEDKWSEEVLKCLADAKASVDVEGCQKKMTKEQADNMAKAITAAMATQEPVPEPPDQGSGSETGSAGSGSAAPSANLPAECAAYKAAIEKLATCDKLPQDARDTMKKGFEAAEKTWADFDKLPDAAKKTTIESCTKATDALKKAAAGCNL